MNLEQAKRIIENADGDGYLDYDQCQIDAGEIHKCGLEAEYLGDDYYWLDTALDPDAYDLETEWAHSPCIIGPSDGGHRTVVSLLPSGAWKVQ